MKIEPLEMFRHKDQIFHKGEVRVVPDEEGEMFCGLGWAKDVDNKIATGERKPGASELNIDSLTQPQKSEAK